MTPALREGGGEDYYLNLTKTIPILKDITRVARMGPREDDEITRTG